MSDRQEVSKSKLKTQVTLMRGVPDERAHGPAAVSAEEFRLLVESIRDYAIFLLDPQGIIRSWNVGARRIKGYEANEVIGKSFTIFYPEEVIRSGHPQNELELAARNGAYEEEGWRLRKDGSRFWASVIITALRDPQGALLGFSKVTRDLTDRKRAESELERKVIERTGQLTRAVQERDEFLSIASHELKTPLTSLSLQLQLRKRHFENNDPKFFEPTATHRFLDMMDRQLVRLVRLVDDMLDISRIATGKLSLQLEEVEFGQIVRDVLDRFEPQLEASGCEIRVLIESGLRGSFDRYRMEQVLVNLLTNAIKYAPGKPVEISLTSAEGKANLSVKDHGRGIAKQDLQRIFERFERAVNSANVSGLGLGLYISRRIVEGHGGTIRVESEPGEGATFTITIPLKRKS